MLTFVAGLPGSALGRTLSSAAPKISRTKADIRMDLLCILPQTKSKTIAEEVRWQNGVLHMIKRDGRQQLKMNLFRITEENTGVPTQRSIVRESRKTVARLM